MRMGPETRALNPLPHVDVQAVSRVTNVGGSLSHCLVWDLPPSRISLRWVSCSTRRRIRRLSLWIRSCGVNGVSRGESRLMPPVMLWLGMAKCTRLPSSRNKVSITPEHSRVNVDNDTETETDEVCHPCRLHGISAVSPRRSYWHILVSTC
mgnify:CR=1 FL=1